MVYIQIFSSPDSKVSPISASSVPASTLITLVFANGSVEMVHLGSGVGTVAAVAALAATLFRP